MQNYNEIINKIAEDNSTSYEMVYREMELAILSGKNNPDPKKRKEFAKIPCEGEIPTPEEFMKYMAKRVAHDPKQRTKRKRRKS